MFIISKESNEFGGYPPLLTWDGVTPPEDFYFFPAEYYNEFYKEGKDFKGFVTYEEGENNTVKNVQWNEEAYQSFLLSLPDTTEQERANKLVELSETCNKMIELGMDVQLTDGSLEHFTYTLADQANVSEMFTAVMAGATGYPYHETNGDCKFYEAKDIVAIYSNLSGYKTAQLTYHNQLKQYVMTLSAKEDIINVEYGQELTGEFLENYNTIVAQAKEQMEAILSKLVSYQIA